LRYALSFGVMSSGGHRLVYHDQLIDLDTGDVTDLAPVLADALAAFPPASEFYTDMPGFTAAMVSDNGRYIGLWRESHFTAEGVPPLVSDIVVWDRTTSSSTMNAHGELVYESVEALTDSGAVLWYRSFVDTNAVELKVTDSETTTLVVRLVPNDPSYHVRLERTPDLRTILYSRYATFLPELVASRCT